MSSCINSEKNVVCYKFEWCLNDDLEQLKAKEHFTHVDSMSWRQSKQAS